ncbi:MAG TPA: ATP-binding protein, partial [Caldimonas sp.]
SPLQRVAADVRERDEQSLQPLPTAQLPDEVAPLVQALNALLQRLGASLDKERAFVADAAHELRSPLTALKLQLQLLRRATDEAGRAAAVAGLAAGIDRAARLVEQLLTLARSEPGAPPVAMESVDLSELAREALVDSHAYALARGSELRLDAAQPVVIAGERNALSSALRNLVDNALRYSPPGARVELRVWSEHGAALLRVDDSGPGIPSAERARVFDRFYRRAAGGEEGTGLGLAIVRSVAERHGAELTLGDSPAGGLRVTLCFGGAASAA